MINFLEKNKDISNLSNFKTKAIVKYYFELDNRQDLDKLNEVMSFAIKNNIEILFIWSWTNLLFAFDFFDWIIIKNNLLWWNYDKKNKILFTNSWEIISEIAKNLEKDFKQPIWHRFIWLPWTIWGAVCGNAGCFWLEAENNFLEAEVFNLNTWKIEILNKKKMKFSYRSSILKAKNNYFLINSKFNLSQKQEKYSSLVDNIDYRENKQPKWNTCWSFFKNPSKNYPAWKLIEMVWLKWFNVNWAYFSNMHANFLINDGSATYEDLINLIDLAKNKVKIKFDIDLIPEVIIIYNVNK